MKKITTGFLALSITVLVFGQHPDRPHAHESQPDSITTASTTGIFDGKFTGKTGYMINEYYVSLGDISPEKADSLKGKRVTVTGRLKIVKGGAKALTYKAGRMTGNIFRTRCSPSFTMPVNLCGRNSKASLPYYFCVSPGKSRE